MYRRTALNRTPQGSRIPRGASSAAAIGCTVHSLRYTSVSSGSRAHLSVARRCAASSRSAGQRTPHRPCSQRPCLCTPCSDSDGISRTHTRGPSSSRRHTSISPRGPYSVRAAPSCAHEHTSRVPCSHDRGDSFRRRWVHTLSSCASTQSREDSPRRTRVDYRASGPSRTFASSHRRSHLEDNSG